MLEDPGGLGIVDNVVRMAQAFNRPVIAEGVETLEHGAMLMHLGCRHAQGYGIAKPMPAEQLPAWIQSWQASATWRTMVRPLPDQDVTLLVAAQSHRVWVESVHWLVDHPADESQFLADCNCSFGRWFEGSAVASYGKSVHYTPIGELHDRAHALAAQALQLVRAAQPAAAQDCLQDLFNTRDQLLSLLARLPRGDSAQMDSSRVRGA
jgi:hypothetical protein